MTRTSLADIAEAVLLSPLDFGDQLVAYGIDTDEEFFEQLTLISAGTLAREAATPNGCGVDMNEPCHQFTASVMLIGVVLGVVLGREAKATEESGS